MTSSKRIDAWDGWRGLAILLVLVGHFTFSKWIWEERLGVDVFFVLSGMLMSNILFIDRMALRDFYVRRISRVFPALVVFLLGALLVSVVLKYDFQLKEFIASLFFIRTYVPVEPEYFSTQLPTGHLWSLNVEEHSYVIMSLLSVVLIARVKAAYALFFIYVLSTVINTYNYINMGVEEFNYSLIRTESAIGFVAFSASYNLMRSELQLKCNPHLPLLLLVLAAVCYLAVLPIWLMFVLSPVLLGVAVNHILDAAKYFQMLLRFAPLRWFGVLSYSIYLWQQIFYKLTYALPGHGFTGFLLSIVVGAGSFHFVENPLRNYINQRWCPKPNFRATLSNV